MILVKQSMMDDKTKEPGSLHLKCTPENIHWGFLDGTLEACASVNSGDTVVMNTLSGGTHCLPRDRTGLYVLPDHKLLLETCQPHLGPHFLTGPVDLCGARPGDVLEVEISAIELRQNWGWNGVFADAGLFPEMIREDEIVQIPIDLEASTLSPPWCESTRAEPFFGILSTRPDPAVGRISSVVPGPFGGNIDNRLLSVGSNLFLPVFTDGAGFSVGDGHALQGDGEVCDSAVETALSGAFRLFLRSGKSLERPLAIANNKLITMGFDPDLNLAVKQAGRDMLTILIEAFDMCDRTALRHCSLFGHLAITQVVNVNQGVHFALSIPGVGGGELLEAVRAMLNRENNDRN